MDQVKKIPLVLFSGGLDSTFMLWRYLITTPVDVLYIDGGQGELKIRKECNARTDILELFRSHNTLRTPYQVSKILQPKNKVNFADAPMHFKQMPAWLIGALEMVDDRRHSALAIGNVLGDDIWPWRSDIERAWEGLCRMTRDVHVPLVFPLQNWKKFRILQHMPPSLYERIWYCELPKMADQEGLDGIKHLVACGSCPSCVTHAVELYRFKLMTGMDHKDWLAQDFYVDINDEDFCGVTIRNKSERHESQRVPVHEIK